MIAVTRFGPQFNQFEVEDALLATHKKILKSFLILLITETGVLREHGGAGVAT